MATDEQIGTAIVARFNTATPPSGEEALALVTADPPDEIGAGPAIVVFLPDEQDMDWPPGHVDSRLWFRAIFFRTQGPESGSRMLALKRWRVALRFVLAGQIQLGLHADGVDWAYMRSMTVLEAEYPAGQKWDAIDMRIEVKNRQPVAAAA